MKLQRQTVRILALILVPCLVLSALAASWVATRGFRPADDDFPEATIGDSPADLTQLERAQQFDESGRITRIAYRTVVTLRMSDGPTRPDVSADAGGPSAVSLGPPVLGGAPARFSPRILAVSLRPIGDFFETIQIQAPTQGAVLQAGTTFTLQFTLANPVGMKFDIYLSTDGGSKYTEIEKGVLLDSGASLRTYDLVVPATPSAMCEFRVETYFDDARTSPYAAGVSPRFTIAVPVTPTPTKGPTPKPTPTQKPTPTPGPTPTAAPSPTLEPTPVLTPVLTPAPSPTPMPTPTPAPSRYLDTGVPFLNRNADATRWISLDIATDQAETIVWQVSRTPFIGFATEDTLDPRGLLASGEVDPQAGAFPLDFNALVGRVEIPVQAGTTPPENDGTPFSYTADRSIVYQAQYNLYLRAVAVDRSGTVIGDPGEGMELQFGVPRTVWNEAIDTATSSLVIRVWSAEAGKKAGTVGGNPVLHVPDEGFLAHPDDEEWNLEVRSAPVDTYTCVFQVATEPFEKGVFDNPKGLVFDLDWAEGLAYDNLPIPFSLPLHAFVPPASDVGSKILKYYGRMVFKTRSPTGPGELVPIASETQVIYYTGSLFGRDLSTLTQADFLPTEIVRVRSRVPLTRFMSYEPMQWESPDWKQWFEVTRRIEAHEMAFTIHNYNVGKTLYPYSRYHFDLPTAVRQLMFFDKDPYMTLEQYQATLDEWLPVGANFPLSIEDSSSLWGEMWNLASSIYTSVSNAYNGAKAAVIETVVSVLPDGKLKDAVQVAVTILADTGLAMIGLPPTLPDFTALASEGLDYALEIAVSEACAQVGIPPNEITDEIRSQIRNEMMAEIESRAASTYTNPLGVGYLKPASDRIYRPGSFVLLVNNTGSERSVPGTATFGYSTEGGGYVPIYRSQSFPIPALEPGQYIAIPIYLKETPTTTSEWTQFRNLFFGLTSTPCRFSLHVTYDVPDLMTAVGEQDLENRPDNDVFLRDEFIFDHPTTYAYTYIGLPSEPVTEPDPAVDGVAWDLDEVP